MTKQKLIELLQSEDVKVLPVEVKEVNMDGEGHEPEITFARSSHDRNKSGWANKEGFLVVMPQEYSNNEDESKGKPQ